MGPIALGGDGGGSVRIPASFSGLFGMKDLQVLVGDPIVAALDVEAEEAAHLPGLDLIAYLTLVDLVREAR